jgi:hypothetical protein
MEEEIRERKAGKSTDPPDWACSQWGAYEHDWLDCPDCVAKYEEQLDSEES